MPKTHLLYVLIWIQQRTAGLSGNLDLDMVLRELLDLPVGCAERAANFRNYPCILGVRNPRIGEPASALRTISRFWGETKL